MSQQPNKVLVIDDDDVFRRRLARAFLDRGYQVAEASCGADVFANLKNIQPTMVVLDLKLVNESGLDILKELTALDATIKVVVLTGYGTITTAVDAMKLGATNYLTKPVDADTILAAFDSAGHQQQQPHVNVHTPHLAQVEWDHINRVINDCDGNITRASKALGLHRRSLQRKLLKNPSRLK